MAVWLSRLLKINMTEFEYKFINQLKEKGVTKREVMECLDITQPTLKSRLNNFKSFKLDEIEKIRIKFKIDILQL